MRVIVEYGKARTGLAPLLTTFMRLDTMVEVTPRPVVSEIQGTGSYYFDYSFATDTSPDVFFQMDAGSSVPTAERFRSGTLSPSDSFLDKRVSRVALDGVTVEVPPVNLQPVIDAVNATSTFIKGPGNKTVTDVYNKVQNVPESGIASQAAVDTAIESARADLAGRIEAESSETQSNLSAALTAAQTAIQNLILAAKAAIMGAGEKSITDVDAYTQNLPADPASQALLAAVVNAARDSTNATVMSGYTQLRGEGDQSLEDIFAKVQGLPDQELAQAAQVAALPAALLALIGGPDFDASKDTLHKVRGAVDGNAAKLDEHADMLARVLGMLKENAVLDNVTYDSENNLTSGRLRLYKTKEAAAQAVALGENDDSTPDKLAEYVISGNYIGGLLESYLVTRESP